MICRKRLAGPMLALSLLAATGAAAQCPPAGWSMERLQALKSDGFLVAAGERQQLALDLLGCLGEADPVLRDGIAFEAYTTWLRGNLLEEPTRRLLLRELLPQIAPDGEDAAGFRQPFAALVLAELARVDRRTPYLTASERGRLVDAAAVYLASVRDYRGFDPVQGWRHGVAHGADLLMQLALNVQLEKTQLDQLLAAISRQVAPAGEHSYIHDEPARLARPLLFVAMRGLHGPDDWRQWFGKLAEPAPLQAWSQAHASQAGLSKRHNTRAFLLAVFAEIRDSRNEHLAAMLPAVNAALAEVP